MYIYIKLINERLAQQESVAIAKVLSLVDEVVTVCMLGSLRLAQSSALSAHRNTPLLLVCELAKCIAIERAMVENAARCFQIDIAIYERVVDAIRYTYAEMLNLAVKLLAVDAADNAYKNSNFHFCSPFQSVSKTFNERGYYVLNPTQAQNNQNRTIY